MSSPVCLVLLSACVLFTCSSGQRSCRDRCGYAYSRGSECQCDYECLSHNECCKNYESACTARGSCKGRCGEHFKRGRQCHCDIECIKYNQCCPDYETQCTTEDSSMDEVYSEFDVTTSLDETATQDIKVSPYDSPYDTAELLDRSENQMAPLPYPPDFGAMPSTIDSPIMDPDKDPKGPQDNFEPEQQLSPNSSAPTSPPASTTLAVTQQPSEQPAATTKPTDIMSASKQTDLNAETTAPITTEPKSTDAYNNSEITSKSTINPQPVSDRERLFNNASVSTVSPEMTSIRQNSTPTSENATTNVQSTSEPKPTASATDQTDESELEPFNSVQSDDQELNLANQTEAQLEPSKKNTTSERPEIQKTVSTDKPIIEKITEAQTENQDANSILSIKDSSVSPAVIKSTAASLTLSTSPSKEQEKPTKPSDTNDKLQELQDYQADANSDTNLCSGRPVNGLTTLRNSSIVVFRGHYFWMLDPRRNAGPAQLITDNWGIPSPIDTAFTRCNCHGKTYIFKGDKYWRFENDIMDAGFPRSTSEGFDLKGPVVAALSMPKYRSRRESVLFFKRGGVAQRYSYLKTPDCGSRAAAVIVRKRFRKETVLHLGPEMDIRKTWVGFPTAVTSAVSVPTTLGDGYKYYVFSPTKYYSLKIERDTPVILTPTAGREKQRSAKSWFRCPETSKM